MYNSNLREIIWQIVAAIPKGRVATYGQVAEIAGYPSHARFVGATLRALPKNSAIPWHRVINSQGKISFPVGSEPYEKQRSLLISEGVVFLNAKVSLQIYGWK
jgi:methylated-DNA-protein-cysteine methyltransferase-like protein